MVFAGSLISGRIEGHSADHVPVAYIELLVRMADNHSHRITPWEICNRRANLLGFEIKLANFLFIGVRNKCVILIPLEGDTKGASVCAFAAVN